MVLNISTCRLNTLERQQTFETRVAVESVLTEAATELTAVSAQLNGSLDPNGEDAHYHFQYVTDTAFQAEGFMRPKAVAPTLT